MKNWIYLIMDFVTVVVNLCLLGAVVIHWNETYWSPASVALVVTMAWVTIRLIRIHWYIHKTTPNAKKSVKKVINR